jgi:hypothetical protein
MTKVYTGASMSLDDKVVGGNGGTIARQCLEAGLLDESIRSA